MEEKNKLEFVKRDLTDVQLEDKKLQLIRAKLIKDKTDLQLAELEEQLDLKFPEKFLNDSISEMEKDITDKKVTRNNMNGREISDATETDIEFMKSKLKFMNKMKKLDIPLRDLRLQIHDLRSAKKQIDAPEQQIRKLENEIRERKETILSSRDKRELPAGVG